MNAEFVTEATATMGGEDFAYFAEKVCFEGGGQEMRYYCAFMEGRAEALIGFGTWVRGFRFGIRG